MVIWLDHLLFGNGHGLGSPYFDQRFFWLSGDMYTWIGGHGAQLQSFQWFSPKPGEERVIKGRKFRPFNVSRTLFRVRVSWSMVGLSEDINMANRQLAELRKELDS